MLCDRSILGSRTLLDKEAAGWFMSTRKAGAPNEFTARGLAQDGPRQDRYRRGDNRRGGQGGGYQRGRQNRYDPVGSSAPRRRQPQAHPSDTEASVRRYAHPSERSYDPR
jgi:hypothetical protein